MHIFGIGVLNFRQSWLEAIVRKWISAFMTIGVGYYMVGSGI